MKFRKTPKYITDLRISLILIILAVALISTAIIYFAPEYEQLKKNIESTAAIQNRINMIAEQTNEYDRMLQESGKLYTNLYTARDAYVEYLGSAATRNNLSLNKMTVDEIEFNENRIGILPVRLEVEGDAFDVKNFLITLSENNTINRIVSFSYRAKADTEENLSWMHRWIDDEFLISWWTSLKDDKNPSSGVKVGDENEQLLSADMLMTHKNVTCYIEIEYLGAGG